MDAWWSDLWRTVSMIKHKGDFVIQAFIILLVVGFGTYFYLNVSQQLNEDNIASGFGFLSRTAGFDVIQDLIPFYPTSTFLRAFFVGVLNTLLVTGLAMVCGSTVGFLVALARLSQNWLLARIGTMYVEFFRNVPLLLQILFWYFVMLRYMPQLEDAWHPLSFITVNVQGIFIGPFIIIPELSAMLLGLSLYSGGYIAEIIRNGIKSVDRGQVEASISCGLSSYMTLRFIVLPQSYRLIIPPLVNQYVNILKNSSLGSAVGYPDLVAVFAGTVLNQTGQAIETIFMTMSFYLLISVVVAQLLHLYSIRAAPKTK